MRFHVSEVPAYAGLVLPIFLGGPNQGILEMKDLRDIKDFDDTRCTSYSRRNRWLDRQALAGQLSISRWSGEDIAGCGGSNHGGNPGANLNLGSEHDLRDLKDFDNTGVTRN